MQIGQIGRAGRVGLAPATGVPWWAAAKYRAIDTADGVTKRAAAIADFRRWRFAITIVASGSISGATAADLGVMREATFVEWFAFTSGGGTYIDASGVMQTAASNTPRRDYSTGVGRLGLNNAATNLISNTTSWPFVSGNAVYTPNVGTLLGKPASTIRQRPAAYGPTYQSAFVQLSASASTSYTRSVYLKSDGQRWVYIQQYYGTTNAGAYFDLQAGVKGNVDAGITADIVPCGDGVYRCSVTNQTGGSATYERLQIALVPGNGGSPTYVGDGVSGVYAALPQLEASAFASPAIETAGAATTRPIETCQFGAVPTALMQRSAATVVVRGRLSAMISGSYPRLVGGSADKAWSAISGSTGGGTAYDGSNSASAAIGSGSPTTGYGLATAFDASSASVSVNGGTVGASAAWNNGAMGNPVLGKPGTIAGNAIYGDGFYDELIIFPFRVANADLPRLAVPYA